MNPYEALKGLRIGCVRYLNARPLIEPLFEADPTFPVIFEHPSLLAAALKRGELDVALVPVYEAIHSPGYALVDGVAIASLGTVWSVYIAYQGALETITEISLDPASLTSINLGRLLFAEWGPTNPLFCSRSEASPGAAQLLIGDQAIAFREEHGDSWNYLDFGEAWLERTGLPFVFATWLMRPGLSNAPEIAESFRTIARKGEEKAEEIAARYGTEYPADFARKYLTEYIRFSLGTREKEGLFRFKDLLEKHSLLRPEMRVDAFHFV